MHMFLFLHVPVPCFVALLVTLSRHSEYQVGERKPCKQYKDTMASLVADHTIHVVVWLGTTCNWLQDDYANVYIFSHANAVSRQ